MLFLLVIQLEKKLEIWKWFSLTCFFLRIRLKRQRELDICNNLPAVTAYRQWLSMATNGYGKKYQLPAMTVMVFFITHSSPVVTSWFKLIILLSISEMSRRQKYCRILHCEHFHGCKDVNIRFFRCVNQFTYWILDEIRSIESHKFFFIYARVFLFVFLLYIFWFMYFFVLYIGTKIVAFLNC